MSEKREYYYNQQFKRYLIQFMAIFSGMQVEVGRNETQEPRLISIPVYSASKDRVVGAIKGENTQNKPLRLPAMSAWINSINLAPEMRKGIPNVRRNTYMPTGGLFPDDMSVVSQRMPVPYKAGMELTIWASNQDQHFQIMEQILMLFNPILQIQTSDEQFDWTKITQVELTNIGLEETVPIGTDRRMIRSTLQFEVPVHISAPAEVHQRYIKQIYMRVGAVDAASITSYEIVADLDSQQIEYEKVFDVNDVNLPND